MIGGPLSATGPLSTIGATSFAVLMWGAIALVAVVFGYVTATYARELLTESTDGSAASRN